MARASSMSMCPECLSRACMREVLARSAHRKCAPEVWPQVHCQTGHSASPGRGPRTSASCRPALQKRPSFDPKEHAPTHPLFSTAHTTPPLLLRPTSGRSACSARLAARSGPAEVCKCGRAARSADPCAPVCQMRPDDHSISLSLSLPLKGRTSGRHRLIHVLFATCPRHPRPCSAASSHKDRQSWERAGTKLCR